MGERQKEGAKIMERKKGRRPNTALDEKCGTHVFANVLSDIRFRESIAEWEEPFILK
jgi:hypothetical protein